MLAVTVKSTGRCAWTELGSKAIMRIARHTAERVLIVAPGMSIGYEKVRT
jgi:hypothetical protein